MKLSTELKDLPIVSIAEGEEVGIVKDFIIDPENKAVVALVVEDKTVYYEGVKVISFSLIHSIGDFAITTENTSSVVVLSNMPELIDLIKKELRIVKAKVITRSGRLIGYVKEYSIDSRTGEIVGLELSSDSDIATPENNVIPAGAIVTLGKDVIIVSDDVETQLASSHAELIGLTPPPPKPKPAPAPAPEPPAPKPAQDAAPQPEPEPVIEQQPEPVVFEEESQEQPEPEEGAVEFDDDEDVDIEELLDLDSDAEASGLVDEPTEAEEDSSAPEFEEAPSGDEDSKESLSEIFERRQIKYMIGKKVSREIQSDDGITIAEQGETITDDIINKAKEAGKFLELSMNIEIEE